MAIHTETVRQGAAANRRKARKNPLQIMFELRDAEPNAEFADILPEYIKRVERNRSCLLDVLEYAARNHWAAYDRDHRVDGRRGGNEKAKTELRARAKTEAARIVNSIARSILKTTIVALKDGSFKPLALATFGECAEAGGWLSRIANLGEPHQIVGEHVTEEQVRNLLETK